MKNVENVENVETVETVEEGAGMMTMTTTMTKVRRGRDRERGGGKEGGNERKRKRDAVAPPYVCHTCTHISLCLQVVLAVAVATKRSYCATLFPLATLHHTLYVLKIVTHAL